MATSDSSAAQRRTIPIAAAPERADLEGLCGSGEAFALMVLGDSMAPEFTEGDVVIIEPEGLARDGSYVLAQVAGEFIFRRLGRAAAGWNLQALQPGHPVIELPDLNGVRGVIIQKSRPGRRRETRRYVE
ncbi:MAG TPA: S24 family peptidase [Burkholderiaceae bacterium]|nr:S24 family peptidase [Burkholderiaceae bacterium]HQR70717.1 S24 family peptidase [Burkholderiaceae bacterium]